MHAILVVNRLVSQRTLRAISFPLSHLSHLSLDHRFDNGPLGGCNMGQLEVTLTKRERQFSGFVCKLIFILNDYCVVIPSSQ